jgi:hypothetical protein
MTFITYNILKVRIHYISICEVENIVGLNNEWVCFVSCLLYEFDFVKKTIFKNK